MGNGRGALECCYCKFFRCHNPLWLGYDAAYEEGDCTFHNCSLPATTDSWTHRICRDFQPNEYYEQHRCSVEERFSWFELPLEAGVLYGFHDNSPEAAQAIGDLGPNRS